MKRKFDLTKAAEPRPGLTAGECYSLIEEPNPEKRPAAWVRIDELGRLIGPFTPEEAKKYWGGARWGRFTVADLGLMPVFGR